MCDTQCGVKPVKQIPGDLVGTRTVNLNVRSYAGFVDHGADHMFLWLFEAQGCLGTEKQKDAQVADFPLLIWLNGGPGASSMFGALSENGPYLIQNSDTGSVAENPHAWNQKAHIMYVDNPVGAGYSYNDDGKYVDNERDLGERFYQMLQGLFKDPAYAKYAKCPLYFTGESYGGKYLPFICDTIRQKTHGVDEDGGSCCSYLPPVKPADADDVPINLQGMAVGNPYYDAALQTEARLEMGQMLGYLDTNQYTKLMGYQKVLKEAVDKGDWLKAFNYNQGIKKDLIACGGNVAIYDVRTWDLSLFDAIVEKYFRTPAVKVALNLDKEQPWKCADETGHVTEHLMEDFVRPTQCIYGPLLDQLDGEGNPAYRILIYVGNLDMSCGVAGTERMLRELDWNGQREWQEAERLVWASPKDATKGFIKSLANLTHIVIPGSGHMVPTDQPSNSLEMINRFILRHRSPTYDTPIDSSTYHDLLHPEKE